jgi:hypothetical protein
MRLVFVGGAWAVTWGVSLVAAGSGSGFSGSCRDITVSWNGMLEGWCTRLSGGQLYTKLDLAKCYINKDGKFIAQKG